MAVTPVNMFRGQLTATATTIYTAPSTEGDYAIVKEIIACNTDTTDRYLTVYNVAFGGSASPTNAILDTVLVPAKTTAFFELSSVLEDDDFLSASTSAWATITLTVSGVTGT